MEQPSLKKQIYDSILNDILQNVYPNDAVLNEKKLTEKYGVSKSPVRDALIELCNQKILRSIPRYGYVIVQITEQEIQQITEFRLFLETSCFRSSYMVAYDQLLNNVRSRNWEFKRYTSEDRIDFKKCWDYNIDFHLSLVECVDNPYLSGCLENSLSTLYRAYSQLYRHKVNSVSNFGAINEYHQLIQQYLEEKNLEKAVETLVRDIEDVELFVAHQRKNTSVFFLSSNTHMAGKGEYDGTSL